MEPANLENRRDVAARIRSLREDYGYTAEEISKMMLVFNPDVTIADLQADADTYSLSDVMERHADLIG